MNLSRSQWHELLSVIERAMERMPAQVPCESEGYAMLAISLARGRHHELLDIGVEYGHAPPICDQPHDASMVSTMRVEGNLGTDR